MENSYMDIGQQAVYSNYLHCEFVAPQMCVWSDDNAKAAFKWLRLSENITLKFCCDTYEGYSLLLFLEVPNKSGGLWWWVSRSSHSSMICFIMMIVPDK